MSPHNLEQELGGTRLGPSAATPSDPALPQPGESPATSSDRTRAVGDALTQLGHQADPKQVAALVKAQTGLELDPGEVSDIQRQLLERIATAPSLDQPPPEAARRNPLEAAGGTDKPEVLTTPQKTLPQ